MVPYPPRPTNDSDALNRPEAAALLRDPAALKRLLCSPETRRLISLLQQQGDLRSAAEQAKTGDPSALRAMLGQLQNSPEGGEALNRLEKRLEN